MGGHPGFYKSGKRNKELARQKKQEEKKLRRLNKAQSPEQEGLEIAQEVPVSDEVTKGPEE
jgi:hypothetical protein